MTETHALFPFVVGCGRSGTELLRAMLTSHSELAIPAESQFIVRGAQRFDRQPFKVDQFYDWFAGLHRNRSQWQIDIDHLRVAASVDPPPDYPTAIRTLFQQLALREGKPRYGDKTPSYATHLTELAKLFPEARFIHLVRDGRDVAGSLEEASFGPNHLGACALYWQREIETCRAQGLTLGDMYLEITYEHLVADPERELRRVCAHIDLAYSPSMLMYHADKTLLSNLLAPRHHARLAEPPAIERDWRADRSAREIALLESLVGSTLGDFGYRRQLERIPPWAQSWAVAYRAAVAVKQRRARR